MTTSTCHTCSRELVPLHALYFCPACAAPDSPPQADPRQFDLWWEDHQQLAAFARHLVLDECWTAAQLCDMLEEPWKWCEEYHAWRLTVTHEEIKRKVGW